MKKLIIWMAVSCLIAVALSVASCAPVGTDEVEVTPPAEEVPSAAQILATIKLEVTSSTWREGEEPTIYIAPQKRNWKG